MHLLLVMATLAGGTVERGAEVGLVANPRVAAVAYARPGGTVIVRPERGRPRAYAVPQGCRPSGLARDAIGLTCGAHVRLLDRRTGRIRRVRLRLPRRERYVLTAMGARWLQVQAFGTADVPGGHVARTNVLVHRRSGRTIDLVRDPFGSRRTLDLDRRRPAQPLCRGIRRPLAGVGTDARFAPVVRVGRQVFEPAVPRVTDCHTGRQRVLPERAGLAYSGRVLPLLNGRRIAVPTAARPEVAVSRGATWRQAADGTLYRSAHARHSGRFGKVRSSVAPPRPSTS